MKKENNKNDLLKIFTRSTAVLGFISDLITLGLFVKDIYLNTITFTNAISYVGLIVLIFGFAFFLWLYSKVGGTQPKTLYQLFSWFYVAFSALIFGIISYRFITEAAYNFGEYIGYIFLVMLVAGLGLGISYITKMHRIGYYAIPFMLVALEQIVLWIFKIVSHEHINFDLQNFGNLFIFIIASLFILSLLIIKEKK